MSLSIFKMVSLFSGLSDDDLKEILELTTIKKYSKDNPIIFKEGDSGDSFYVITKGKVNVTRKNENGKVVVISIMGPGDFFGEMSLIDGLPRSANIISITDTEVLVMNREDFLNLVNRNSKISFNLTKNLCERIRKLDALMKRIFTDEYYL